MHHNGYTAAPAPSSLPLGAYVLLPADDPRLAAPPPPVQAEAAGPLLLTVVQVGEQLALSESTVRDLINRRDDPLPSVKIGTARRIRRDDLVAWLDRESGRGGAR